METVARSWNECEAKLDAARTIDSAGESDAHVIAARRAIAQARQEQTGR